MIGLLGLAMPSGAEVAFYLFAAIAVVSAIAMVTRNNPVVAAVWLVGSFIGVAACYLLLHATFLAVIQVLVYAGAMMVLFVFVIMVLDVDESGMVEHRRTTRIGKLGYYGLFVIAGGFLTWVMLGTAARQFITPGVDLTDRTDFGTANGMGRELFRHYLFAFEAISLLLMAAVIGAVVVARSRKEREKEALAAGMDEASLQAAGLGREGADAPELTGTDFGKPSATGHGGGV